MKPLCTTFLMFSSSVSSPTLPIFPLAFPPVATSLCPPLALVEPRALSIICVLQASTLELSDLKFFVFLSTEQTYHRFLPTGFYIKHLHDAHNPLCYFTPKDKNYWIMKEAFLF